MINKLDYPYSKISILSDVKDDDNLNTYKLKGCQQLEPTKDNIMNEINSLIEQIPEYSFVFFHYSGHGVSVDDATGDELDGKDEAL